jgi:hypothetical protein
MALRTVRESTYPLVTVDAGLASVLSIASPLEVEDIKVFGDGSCAGLGRVVAGDVVNKVRTDPQFGTQLTVRPLPTHSNCP